MDARQVIIHGGIRIPRSTRSRFNMHGKNRWTKPRRHREAVAETETETEAEAEAEREVERARGGYSGKRWQWAKVRTMEMTNALAVIAIAREMGAKRLASYHPYPKV